MEYLSFAYKKQKADFPETLCPFINSNNTRVILDGAQNVGCPYEIIVISIIIIVC
jgi:hypothetical protein